MQKLLPILPPALLGSSDNCRELKSTERARCRIGIISPPLSFRDADRRTGQPRIFTGERAVVRTGLSASVDDSFVMITEAFHYTFLMHLR